MVEEGDSMSTTTKQPTIYDVDRNALPLIPANYSSKGTRAQLEPKDSIPRRWPSCPPTAWLTGAC